MRKMNCTLEYVNGHIEVYDGTGAFLFSADTKQEALRRTRRRRLISKKRECIGDTVSFLSYTPNTESA